jgi:hypothetical protein
MAIYFFFPKRWIAVEFSSMTAKPSQDRYQRAVELVEKHHPEATDFKYQKTLTIAQGSPDESHLVFVSYMRPGANPDSPPRSAIYFPAFEDPMHFENSDEFIKWSAGHHSRGGATFWGKVLEASGGVAGLLAVMITGAIIYEYMKYGGQKFEIPSPLATALGTVLGFYFGGKTKEAKETARKS